MAPCSMEEGFSKDKTETSVWTWASSLRNGCIQWPFPRRGVRVRRPDLAGAASMLASKITTLKAKDKCKTSTAASPAQRRPVTWN